MLLTPGHKHAVFHAHGLLVPPQYECNGNCCKMAMGLATIVSCMIVAIIQEIPFWGSIRIKSQFVG